MLSTARIILAFVGEPSLTDDEYKRVREAGKYLAVINENIRVGKENPFEGLSARQRQDLLAYIVFTRENGFTDINGGDTPIEDSVRSLLREEDLFQDAEYPGKNEGKEYLNVQLVKQMHRMPSKPLLRAVDIDAKGNASVVPEDEKTAP